MSVPGFLMENIMSVHEEKKLIALAKAKKKSINKKIKAVKKKK